jgi:ribosomal protein S18 acetylase RimI-like enzyme
MGQAVEIIRPFENPKDRDQLIALWRNVFDYYSSPHNDPTLSLDKKLAANDGLLFVAKADGRVVGSIMAGYDGHRGWLYSLAVLPEYRHRGIGTRLVHHAEANLQRLGCPKINLQVMPGNEQVEAFYRQLGYQTEPRISMGKKLVT